MPKVSQALDDLSLCAGEQSTGILCWVILGCMRRSQVCWGCINLHSHKQMSKQAKEQAKGQAVARTRRVACMGWFCGAPTHC